MSNSRICSDFQIGNCDSTLTMGISEILGGVLAPSAAGRAADLKGLGLTMWILVGIVVAIIVLPAMLRETAPSALARRNRSEH
jgi:MFS transporter, ACS family, hexuronate transporter